MTTLTEGKQTGEFLLSYEGNLSFDEAVVTSTGALIPSGTILGKVTASGKLKPYSNGASDGSEVAVAVLMNEVSGPAGDYSRTIVSRSAEVIESMLTGIDSAAKVDLSAKLVVVR
jgi:hypothetical protein